MEKGRLIGQRRRHPPTILEPARKRFGDRMAVSGWTMLTAQCDAGEITDVDRLPLGWVFASYGRKIHFSIYGFNKPEILDCEGTGLKVHQRAKELRKEKRGVSMQANPDILARRGEGNRFGGNL
jgi:hypothetical protein